MPSGFGEARAIDLAVKSNQAQGAVVVPQ
jgi:hypothetical protein